MCFAQSVLNARRSVALLRKTQIGCIWGVGILVLPLASGGGGMADALVSGASDRKVVEVQLLSAAPAPTTTQGCGAKASLRSQVERSSPRTQSRMGCERPAPANPWREPSL